MSSLKLLVKNLDSLLVEEVRDEDRDDCTSADGELEEQTEILLTIGLEPKLIFLLFRSEVPADASSIFFLFAGLEFNGGAGPFTH